jgi:hypothetical protein
MKYADIKMHKVMGEFGAGKLHSGSPKGKVVTDRKQAIAIGISEGKKKKKQAILDALRKK